MERDFKYRKLVVGQPPSWESMTIPISDCLREISETFRTNLNRGATFAFAPAQISYFVRVHQRLLACAVLKITGKLEPVFPTVVQEGQKAQITAELNALDTQFKSLPNEKLDELRKDGVTYIEKLLANEGMQVTLDAIFASVVVESWTAFETLASDVWYIALKCGPSEWRKRAAMKLRKKSGDTDDADLPDVSTLSDPGWDYFSFVRDTDAASFQKLSTIKAWYKATFGKQAQQKMFASDTYIDALSAVRNVLTHKAGMADGKYVTRVLPFHELNATPKGKPVQLNGEIVRRLRDAAVTVGNEILLFVDQQLTHALK